MGPLYLVQIQKLVLLSIYYVARHERRIRVKSLGKRKTPTASLVSAPPRSSTHVSSSSFFSFLSPFEFSSLPLLYHFPLRHYPRFGRTNMARIVSDPALDFQPDFASVTFEGLRNRVIGGMQTTHEEVVTGLVNTWQQDHNLRMAARTRQVEEDTRLVAMAAQVEQEQLEQEHLHSEQEPRSRS